MPVPFEPVPFEPERLEPLACAQVMEHLEAGVDGDLSAPRAAEVEAHLEGCPACSAEHRLAVAVRRELRALPQLDTPPAVLRSISQESERARFRAPRGMTRLPAWARLVAALFAAAAVGTSLWWGALRPTSPATPPATADPAVVARATEEARYALAYLTRVNRRAGLKLRDDLFVDRLARPAARVLARSFSPHLRKSAAGDTHDGGRPGRDRS